MRTVENLDGNQVYLTLNVPNEFTTIENLKDWDRSNTLGEIQVPTMITCGRYDEIGPNCAATLSAGIPYARQVLFDHSAHLAHVEEREYMRVLGSFLREHDRSTVSLNNSANLLGRLPRGGFEGTHPREDSGAFEGLTLV